MNSLEAHIVSLLYTCDCIIVPGLGGFVKREYSACYDAELRKFMPPRHSISYNAQLNLDDGLLAQSYMSSDGLTYEEAKEKISSLVADIMRQLKETGQYRFVRIGTLIYADGTIEYGGDDEGNYSYDTYGCAPFAIECRQSVLKDSASRTFELPSVKKKTSAGKNDYSQPEEKHVIGLYLQQAVAIALTVVLFAFMTNEHLNLWNSTTDAVQKTSVMNGFVFGANTNMHSVNTTLTAKKKVPEVEETRQGKRQQEAEPKPMIERKNNYTIVLASSVSKHNANAYIKEMNRKGFSEASVYETNSMRRVIYSSFPSQEDARKMLKSLRSRSADFSEAWVLKLKS